jgi:dienelactone hydrolase
VPEVIAAMRPLILYAAMLLLCLLTQAHAAEVNLELALPGGPLNERVVMLRGDPGRPVSLQVTLFTPPGPGPFPLAVMNHGANFASNKNRGERERYTYSAYYFLSRGYAVALPMARGFAGSGGDIIGRGCDLEAVGIDNARDLRAVIRQLREMPFVDPNSVVVAGQSFGGWTTLALDTMDIPGLHGVIAFMPTLRASDCREDDAAMIRGAGAFGQHARLPSLWFFGDNDQFNPQATWRAMFRLYNAQGGRADLVAFGRFMQDSHQLLSFPESQPIWTVKVDAFLARIGLPAAEIHPEYLPLHVPPPSHFAAIGDVAAIPLVNEAAHAAYEKFLALKFPRVFAIAPDGSYSIANAGFDPLARALHACTTIGRVCQPYAVDDEVVWAPPPVPVVAVSRQVPSGVEEALNFAFSVAPDCQSRTPPQIRVTQPPAHGTATLRDNQGHPNFAEGNKLATCNASVVKGTSLAYQSAPGYVGPDRLTFQETLPNGALQAYQIELNVH